MTPQWRLSLEDLGQPGNRSVAREQNAFENSRYIHDERGLS
jgi:hypothetical protein